MKTTESRQKQNTISCPYCHNRRGKIYEIQPMLYKEIKLLEEIAGLKIEQIQDMELRI